MKHTVTHRTKGFCIWLTGLSGAGKSTISDRLTQFLESQGRTVTVLDGDVVREHLSAGLGFSREDRDTNVRRIGFVASEIVRHGGAVICAAISPYASSRAEARNLVGADKFLLVYVSTPLAVCEQRDPKGLYARVRRGELTQFTGVDDPYESPRDADLILDTMDRLPNESANEVLLMLEARGLLDVREGRGALPIPSYAI
jgi:sulfate adenylyltransferase